MVDYYIALIIDFFTRPVSHREWKNKENRHKDAGNHKHKKKRYENHSSE